MGPLLFRGKLVCVYVIGLMYFSKLQIYYLSLFMELRWRFRFSFFQRWKFSNVVQRMSILDWLRLLWGIFAYLNKTFRTMEGLFILGIVFKNPENQTIFLAIAVILNQFQSNRIPSYWPTSPGQRGGRRCGRLGRGPSGTPTPTGGTPQVKGGGRVPHKRNWIKNPGVDVWGVDCRLFVRQCEIHAAGGAYIFFAIPKTQTM